MIKKITLLICFFISIQTGFAKDYLVRITPANCITTAKGNLQEGDWADFTVTEDVATSSFKLKRGDTVRGLITNLKDNDFWIQPASLYFENFKTKDGKKLKGVVYKQGSDHHMVFDVIFIAIIRGGEVHIMPNKDVFTLSIEDK